MSDTQLLEQAGRGYAQLREQIGRVIIGQENIVRPLLGAMFAQGHVLIIGVPGLAKTLLVKTLAQVLGGRFKRIQFTPDMMPADIIGMELLQEDRSSGTRSMRFMPGPVFAHIVLADEINRAPPKTQSALLETMQEGSVTTGGTTYRLKPPFFVLSTQNPLEQEGTYPLPEAQLDRFMFKIVVPFLSRDDLNEVVRRTILRTPVEVASVMDGDGILHLRRVLDQVVVADPIRDYAVRIVMATHPDSDHAPKKIKNFVQWGASPRAAQALIRAGRVQALADGRVHVAFEDVHHYAREVLQHRILLNYDGQAENLPTSDLVDDVLRHVGTEG